MKLFALTADHRITQSGTSSLQRKSHDHFPSNYWEGNRSVLPVFRHTSASFVAYFHGSWSKNRWLQPRKRTEGLLSLTGLPDNICTALLLHAVGTELPVFKEQLTELSISLEHQLLPKLQLSTNKFILLELFYIISSTLNKYVKINIFIRVS